MWTCTWTWIGRVHRRGSIRVSVRVRGRESVREYVHKLTHVRTYVSIGYVSKGRDFHVPVHVPKSVP